MKTRESGMPDESMWREFFDPATTLQQLGLRPGMGDAVDFGCGYGTYRDFVAVGTGLPDSSVGYAMLFNILHCEAPGILLKEAWRVLVPEGILAARAAQKKVARNCANRTAVVRLV